MGIGYKLLIAYLVVMNILGFFSMGIDKQKAKKGAWRISERTLFLFAIMGGALGSFLGMRIFHHKTKHNQFVIGMPAILLIWIILIVLFLVRIRGTEASRIDFTMGTVISETIYGGDSENVSEEVLRLVKELDTSYLSWREKESAIGILNQKLCEQNCAMVDEKTAEYIKDSLQLCADSGGALDVTIHPLIELWGIEGDSPRIPNQDEILNVKETYGYTSITVSEMNQVYSESVDNNIDLGALGKGIAADEIRLYLDSLNADAKGTFFSSNIKGAVVAIGGTVLVYGEKPGGQAFRVGVRNPRGMQDEYIGYLSLKHDTVVSTSGDYEQYFEEAGIRYHHIFDPKTGFPANQDLMSVTVLCEQGIYSDGLSTACFVLGYEESLELLKKYNAEAIFVLSDKKVLVTDGIRSDFVLTDNNYEIVN